MTVLSDGEIDEALEEGRIGIEGLADRELQIQPSTVDLRLSDTYLDFESEVYYIYPAEDVHDDLVVKHEQVSEIVVRPGDFVLGSTIESVRLPADIQAEVKGRSSYGRFGIEVHSTAGLIDPGWTGDITLEISNNTQKTIILTPGQRICQLSFQELGRPAERPYGSRDDSKYQGQSGATASRAHDDPD